jgi:hypothetical protein
MPSNLPNPYGPATDIGSGIQSITNAMFSLGHARNYGRYGRMRTEQQNAEDAANAQLHQANMGLANAKTAGQLQENAATGPDAGEDFGANVAGLPRNVFRRAAALQRGEMPEGPIPEYGDITPEHQAASIPGSIAAAIFQAHPKGNPEQLMGALQARDQTRDYNRVIAGTLSGDDFGSAVGGFKGNDRYGVADGTQYGKYEKGSFTTTPVGESTIKKNKAQAGESYSRTEKTNAETKNLGKGFFGPAVTVDVGGVPTPKFLGQVSDTAGTRQVPVPKVFAPKGGAGGSGGGSLKLLSNLEVKSMQSQLEALAGTNLDSIDGPTRAGLMNRAADIALDPNSEHHRNPFGAMEQAVKEAAPEGFKDDSGYFSSAKFVPRGGARTTAATGTTAPKAGLPQEARAQLKENHVTHFGNGQSWTLQNGQAVQVQ